MRGYETCYGHRPDLAEERRSNASRGGKSGGRGRGGGESKEASEIRALLKDLTSGVLEHRVNTGTAAVITQLTNARIRLLETEMRVREHTELEARIEALEERGAGDQAGARSRSLS